MSRSRSRTLSNFAQHIVLSELWTHMYWWLVTECGGVRVQGLNSVSLIDLQWIRLQLSALSPLLLNFPLRSKVLSTLHYYTLHYSTVLYATLLWSTVLYATLLYSTVLCATLLYATLCYSTVPYSTLLSCTLLYCTLCYSTLLYATLLYCTLLYYYTFGYFSDLNILEAVFLFVALCLLTKWGLDRWQMEEKISVLYETFC